MGLSEKEQEAADALAASFGDAAIADHDEVTRFMQWLTDPARREKLQAEGKLLPAENITHGKIQLDVE